MTMRSIFAGMFLLAAGAGLAAAADGGATSPADADADFALQGEFVGTVKNDEGDVIVGVQVIALGDGLFRGIGHIGGLPGDGWDGTARITAEARRDGDSVRFASDNGSVGLLTADRLTVQVDGNQVGRLERVVRKSPTLGAAPPEGAVVLFDGKSTDQFPGAKMTEDGLLIAGATSGPKFGSCRVHLEFLLPYMPAARGQGRANSGSYLQGRYEVQILDSFAEEPTFNGAGSLYRTRAPDVNMCLPPLQWQTYDVEFTAPRWAADGSKVRSARVTAWLNGVKVQNNFELPNKTGAGQEEAPTLLPIRFQNHKDPVRFRNIWLIDRGLMPVAKFPVYPTGEEAKSDEAKSAPKAEAKERKPAAKKKAADKDPANETPEATEQQPQNS